MAVDGEDEQAPATTPADRTPAEAVAHRPLRECDGRDGSCGRRYDPDRATACAVCSTEG